MVTRFHRNMHFYPPPVICTNIPMVLCLALGYLQLPVMEMMMEVNVELLCRMTVPSTPIIRPTIGLFNKLESLLKKSPVNRGDHHR